MNNAIYLLASGGNNAYSQQTENTIMNKLLAAFEANPSAKTAKKLLKHLDKHPMAECFIDSDTHNKAKELLNNS